MREAFPSLPFDSNNVVAEENLLPSISIASAALSTTSVFEQTLQAKLNNGKLRHTTISLSSSLLSSNCTTTTTVVASSSSVAPSSSSSSHHKKGSGIAITEKIINNNDGETIEEALVDNDSDKNVVLDSHSAQSNPGNLPPTVVVPTGAAAATLAVATATATTTATLQVNSSAVVGAGNVGTSSSPSSSSSTAVAAATTVTTTTTAAAPSFGELDELQSILHFPEEVALRITDTEYHLFYQVSPNDFINDSILELRKEQKTKSSNQNHTSLSTTTTSVSCGNGGGGGGSVRGSQQQLLEAATNGIGAETNSSSSNSIAAAAEPHHQSEYKSSLNSIRKRFEETSAWTNYFVLLQGTQDERKAAFACLLRVAISCWNIGNFNGAKEIVDGLKQIKRELIWSSEQERARNSAFDFLANVFDTIEYKNALARALAIPTCRTVPYFKNHLNELKQLLRMVPEPPLDDDDDENVPLQQHAKYYLGETRQNPREDDEEMLQRLSQLELPLRCPASPENPPAPAETLEDHIYQRVLPALNTITSCITHHQTLCRELPHSLQEFLRTAANSPRQTKIPLYQPSNLQELEEDYEVEIGNYNPVQPLFYDHGVSIVPLSTKKSNVVDHHILQILHHGTTAVLWEPEIPAERSTFVYLRLERSCSCISWQRTAWRRIKSQQDMNLNQNPEENVTWRFASRYASHNMGGDVGDMQTCQNLEEGILDIGTVKDIAMGSRNHEYDSDILAAGKRFGLTHVESCISLLYGNSASENRFLCILCPPLLCRTWYVGLHWMLRGFRRQQSLIDRSMLWLKELYIQLYFEEGMCSEPTVSDAIKAFGGQLYLSSMKSLSRTQINDSTQESIAFYES